VKLSEHMQDKGGVRIAALDRVAAYVGTVTANGARTAPRETLPFWPEPRSSASPA
jgi:hypothetical protein